MEKEEILNNDMKLAADIGERVKMGISHLPPDEAYSLIEAVIDLTVQMVTIYREDPDAFYSRGVPNIKAQLKDVVYNQQKKKTTSL